MSSFGSSLFTSSSVNGAATGKATSTSLFGNAGNSGGASTLFAGSNATPSGHNAASSSATTGPSLLSGSTLLGGRSTEPSNGNSSISNSIEQGDQGSKNAQTAYFNSLLEKNKKRSGNNSVDGFSDIPSLQLGLGDISKRIRELGGRDGQEGRRERGADSRAHYLLAASGVNPGKALKDLSTFQNGSGAVSAGPLPQEFDTDTYKYVGQMQQRTTQKMINEGLERANRAFEAWMEDQVSIDWEAQRRKVYDHFGLNSRGDLPEGGFGGSFGRSARRQQNTGPNKNSSGAFGRSTLGRSTGARSVIGTPDRGAPLFGISTEKKHSTGQFNDRFLMEKQSRFAQKVTRMNEARLSELSYPIMGEFLSVELQSPAGTANQVQDAYRALIEICNEDNKPRGAKSRQFAREYLDDNPNSGESITMRREIIDGSRSALEKQFLTQLESLLAKNPKEARIGGVPSNINRIRAYVRLRQSRDDLYPDDVQPQTISIGDEDECCWAIMFFLLRCGLVKEAMQYVRDNAVAFRSIERNMGTYISSFFSSDDRRLPRQQADRINQEYNSMKNLQQGNKRDPYKLACFKIIGRCDLSERDLGKAGQGVEDWMWLQFVLARESNRTEEGAAELFGLEEIQGTVREIGLKHFSKTEDNVRGHGIYFLLQILAGMFENAVDYLYQHSYVSAVHVAIGLAYYGLLRVADFEASENELITYKIAERPQLSFGRMVGYYTRDFRTADAISATDYLSLICLNSDIAEPIGSQQTNICHLAIRELVLETREFVALLGDMRPQTGERVPGAIEKRLFLIKLQDTSDYLSEVTLKAAEVADDAGRIADAVVLYHLAEDYDGVVNTCNRAVSDMLASEENFTPQGLPQLPQREIDQQRSQAQKIEQQGKSDMNPAASSTEDSQWSVVSLTALDSPIDLMKHVDRLYAGNQLYYAKVKDSNRVTLTTLLSIAAVRQAVLESRWRDAFTSAVSTSLLPLDCDGVPAKVRHFAQNVSQAPATISRLIGPLILWVIIALSRYRAFIDQSEYDTGTGQAEKERVAMISKDIMIFVGMIRLRVPMAIWEELGLYQEEMLES